ncbi:spore coat protein [Shewanella mangrovi]|uniref:Spore coat protein n=1 Tax=Shewanella mangrovi TaxID=1515746 RepID=A0A094JES8_9GAMM|nr:UDP-4-amino-4,6-dideoxy-N-acetyl-beta-L-altrosamine transaminase [Shewanella mangrovi]KFZ36549.1 spore coat protein [Shewanella mangrovi]
MISYGKQDISDADIAAVVDTLRSDFLTQGPKVPVFEQAICELTQSAYSVAVSSATAALHLACLALGVGAGDVVWTSPISFLSSANCALYCGADIDFVDIEPTTGNMSADALRTKLVLAEQQGTLPKVIIPVHLAGHSCDMQAIAALAKAYGISIIEDASHGIGGSYLGQPIGCCEYADITVFSFHPVKIVTTAEGGVATTQRAELAEAMTRLRSHGVVRESSSLLRPDEGDWYYEQQMLGFNYRMTELQAALGCSQLQRLNQFVVKRNELASLYQQLLMALPVTPIEPLDASTSARHLQLIRLHQPKLRKAIFEFMRSAGIQVHVHYFPIHLQPYYMKRGFQVGDFPRAEAFYQEILTLPLHPGLTIEDLSFIADKLKQGFEVGIKV